jgi:hypothetical protein
MPGGETLVGLDIFEKHIRLRRGDCDWNDQPFSVPGEDPRRAPAAEAAARVVEENASARIADLASVSYGSVRAGLNAYENPISNGDPNRPS